VVAPVLAASGEPLGGFFSVIALSWTHVLALAGVAAVAASAAALLQRRPDAPLAARLISAAAPAALLAGAALAWPPLRAGILPGVDFVGAADVWAPTNFEQQPMFARRGDVAGLPGASALYGGFAFTLPLALMAVAERLRVPALRASALLLLGWTFAFGVLALTQIRFGNEFAPAAAVSTALLLAAFWRAAGRLGAGTPRALGRAALVALVLLALWPGFRALLLPRLERDLVRVREPARAGDRALATPGGTLYRFAEQMRAATPETSGFLDPALAPEYGVLAPATFGHALRWPGRRAVPVDPFGPYLDAEHFALAESFWRARDEDEAVAILDHFRVRYVVTTGAMALPGPTIAQRLHARDGSAFAAHSHLGRFRLVLAGPAGGRGFPGWPASQQPPYKLFELVPGALLEVPAPPGTRVTAQLGLATPAGYAFEFTAVAVADGSGRAELRLPYASEPSATLVPDGPWRVRTPARELRIAVSETDVQRGAPVAAGD
jgi:asparagine N-glycosylation enzyme membrane subunit Stt3